LTIPEKNWKFSAGDLDERKLWDKYMHAYEQAISNTSTEYAPWHIIPADDKPNARLLVAQILLEELSKHDHIKMPSLSKAEVADLKTYLRALENE
jgi:polyphosphate kinase 2 (PPK2 family)